MATLIALYFVGIIPLWWDNKLRWPLTSIFDLISAVKLFTAIEKDIQEGEVVRPFIFFSLFFQPYLEKMKGVR